jgi:hypothetical protein
MSRTTRLTGAVTGSVGQHDYAALQQALGPTQATLPSAPDIVSVGGAAALGHHPSQRWTVAVRAGAFYWSYLQMGGYTAASGYTATSTVTSSFSVSGGPQVSFRATRLDWLGFDLPVSDIRYSAGSEQLTINPTATWARALSREVDLHLRLGVAYGRYKVSPVVPGAAAPQATESPIGSVDFAFRNVRWNDILFASRVSAGIDYYLDPLLGQGVRRGTVGAGVEAVSRPDWSFGLRGDFATSLGEVPVAPGAIPPDETTFSVILSIHRRLSGHTFAELGGQWSDRGPALEAPDFHFHQRQLLVSVTLGATTEPIPR